LTGSDGTVAGAKEMVAVFDALTGSLIDLSDDRDGHFEAWANHHVILKAGKHFYRWQPGIDRPSRARPTRPRWVTSTLSGDFARWDAPQSPDGRVTVLAFNAKGIAVNRNGKSAALKLGSTAERSSLNSFKTGRGREGAEWFAGSSIVWATRDDHFVADLASETLWYFAPFRQLSVLSLSPLGTRALFLGNPGEPVMFGEVDPSAASADPARRARVGMT
jgi:hypothetical protein